MLKKEILIGILVAIFCLGLTGVAVADDGYPKSDENALTQVYEGGMSDQAGEAATKDIEKIPPAFCTLDLVEENRQMAVNDCTEQDLIVNNG